jgi:uncharacterized membrane protein YfhO
LLDQPAASPAETTPGTAGVSQLGLGHVAVETDGPGPGFVVLSEGYDPGWSARTAQGVSLPVQRVDGLVLGLAVPAGPQHVELTYEPPRWRQGLGASLASLLAVAVWGLLP